MNFLVGIYAIVTNPKFIVILIATFITSWLESKNGNIQISFSLSKRCIYSMCVMCIQYTHLSIKITCVHHITHVI